MSERLKKIWEAIKPMIPAESREAENIRRICFSCDDVPDQEKLRIIADELREIRSLEAMQKFATFLEKSDGAIALYIPWR